MKSLFLIFMFLLSGCTGNYNLLISTGEKPPTFFKITDIKTMNNFVFDTQKFSFKLPLSKETDFTQIGGWDGESMRDGHTIALSLSNSIVYSIVISADYKPLLYGKKEKAIENGDIVYINNLYHKYHPDKDISIQRHGKEDYFCEVREGVLDKHLYPNKKEISFGCYKFNSARTKVKRVALILTYNKPNNHHQSEEYTYEDLLQRSQRVLDSLYIKDGWDE